MTTLLALALFVTADFERAEYGVPTRLSFGAGQLGEQPESVPATRLLASAKATILEDRPNLFGTIGIGVRIAGSYQLSERLWLSAGVEAFEMRNVINASVVETGYALGPLTTGVHFGLFNRKDYSLAPYVRILWPTSTAFTQARQWGLEVGLSQSVEVHPMLSWMQGIMLPVELVGLGGRTWGKFQPTVATELAFHPVRWFELVAGVEIKISNDPGVFEYFAPKGAIRFYPAKGFLFDVKVMMPMFGAERTDYVLSGGIGWVFEPQPREAASSDPAPTPALEVEPASLPASHPTSEPTASL